MASMVEKMSLNFDLENDEYLDFIQELRNKVKDPVVVSHGCPVLPLEKDIGGQHVDVNLQVRGLYKGTLRIRRCDLRLMRYQKPGCGWLDINHFDLYDNSSLLDLGRVPSFVRMSTFVEAVDFLADSEKDLTDLKEKDEMKSSLLVLCVLLCEAAKFRILSSVFDNVFKSGFEVPLYTWMLKLIRDWVYLSKELLGPYHDDTDDCNHYLADPCNGWHCAERRVIGVTCQDLARCLGVLYRALPNNDEEQSNDSIRGTILPEIYSVLVYINGGKSGCIYGTIKVMDGTRTHEYPIFQRGPTECEPIESNDTLTLEGPGGFVDAEYSFQVVLDLKERDSDLQICKGIMYWCNSVVERDDDMFDAHHSVVVRGENGYAIVFYAVYSKAVLATIEATLVLNNSLGTSDSTIDTNICVNGTLVARSDGFNYSFEFEQKYYQTRLFNKVVCNRSLAHQCTPDMEGCKLGKKVKLGVPMPLSRSVVAVHADYSLTIEAALRNSMGEPLVTDSLVLRPREAGVSEGQIGKSSDSYLVQLKVTWKRCSYY